MMGYSILWLSHLAFVLFLIAAACALASRRVKVIWRRFWPILIALVALVSVASYAVTGAFLININVQPQWLFWYGLSLTAGFVAGAFIILKRGLKDTATEEPLARSWPRLKLMTATGVMLFIYFGVIHALETRVMIELTRVYSAASANLINLLPARLPDSLNARALYEQAGHSFDVKKDTNKWLSESETPDFDVTAEKVTLALTDNQEAMQLIKKAVELPGYTVNPGMTFYYNWPIPNYLPYRNLARLFILSAQRKALEQNLSGALEDLAIVDKMAGHFRHCPLLISFMVGGAVDKGRIAGLEYVLARAGRSKLKQIEFPVEVPSSVLSDYWRSFQVEAQGQLQGFAHIAGDKHYRSIFNINAPGPVFLIDTLATSLWRVFFLPSDLKGAKRIATIWTQDAKSFDDIDNYAMQINDDFEAGKFGILTSIATPNYSTYGLRAMQIDARSRLAVLALAITAFKNDTGAYPTKLEDLVPNYLDQVPSDPFNPQQPLQMKPIDGGLDLLSVGPDQTAKLPDSGPIHFYLGREAYEKLRLEPAKEERQKKKKRRKKT
jgi:hypothetical protein